MTSGFERQGQDQGQQNQGDPNQDLIAGGEPQEGGGVNPIIVGEPGGQETSTGGQVRIQADIANNSLVIYANLEMRDEILKALERIDVPQLQVAINVTMAEIRLTDELRYGIQYFLKSKTVGLGNDNGLVSLFAGTFGHDRPGRTGLQLPARQPRQSRFDHRCVRRHHRRTYSFLALSRRGRERDSKVSGRRSDTDRHPHGAADRGS